MFWQTSWRVLGLHAFFLLPLYGIVAFTAFLHDVESPHPAAAKSLCFFAFTNCLHDFFVQLETGNGTTVVCVVEVVEVVDGADVVEVVDAEVVVDVVVGADVVVVGESHAPKLQRS